MTRLDAAGLPHVIEVLRRIQEEMGVQVELMQQMWRTGYVFSDNETTQMATAYCARRADLIGYHRMLTLWRNTQPARA